MVSPDWGRVKEITNSVVANKFSYTWNELFLVNWFISNFFCENTKWKKVSSPHYLKISSKLSKHGLSYSLKRDPRSISKITFYANLRVSPIDTELSGLKNKCCLLFKSAISWPEWGQLDGFAKWSFNFAKITSSLKKIKALSIGLTLKLAQNVILEIDLRSCLRL